MGKVLVEARTLASIGAAIREVDGTDAPLYPREMPEAIRQLGGSMELPLDPIEVYRRTRPRDWLPMPTQYTDAAFLLCHIPDGKAIQLGFTATCSGDRYLVEAGTMADGEFAPECSWEINSGEQYLEALRADDHAGLTRDGYKQCMIKISSPNHGMNSLSFTLEYGFGIVEICCRGFSQNPRCRDLRSLVYADLSNEATDDAGGAFMLFNGCARLKAVTRINISACGSTQGMFGGCRSLIAIPQLDTSRVINMTSMFSGCSSLASIPALDTSQVTDMTNMFSNCGALAAVPQMDTSQVTAMGSMFSGCAALAAVPQMDTSQVTAMGNMFSGCATLQELPRLDMDRVTNVASLWKDCISLLDLQDLTLPSITAFGARQTDSFSNCAALRSIERLYAPKVKSLSLTLPKLRRLTFRTGDVPWTLTSITVSRCNLDHQAIVELIESLPNMAAGSVTLTGNPGLAELTDEDREKAAEKGWTIK